MKNILKNKAFQFLAVLVVGFGFGWLIFGGSSASNEEAHNHESETINQVWTCSMHPQIRKSEAGDCPICGMDLIPLSSDENKEDDPQAIRMSKTAMQLANVQTAVVQLGSATKKMNLTGKISADERNVYTQTAHISGRVERLNINFEGETVRKGQVIGSLYSPQLVTAQEELFIAMQNQESQPQLLAAAKNKLKNWKLTDKQIDQLIKSGKTTEEFPVLADYSGVVLHLKVEKGDYLKEGQAFYEVADLSELWVLLDVHESDLSWINLGDKIDFSVKAFPNQKFSAKVSFIDPIIDPKTRVAKARISVNNSNGLLKPQMLVNATIESEFKTMDKAIVVPKSAVMWTGKRSIVYVKTKQANGLHFKMREVELGTSLGEAYVIQSGLQEGEEVAVNGTFSIDAAAQLAGKPSMMNPEGGTVNTGHDHGGMSDMQKTSEDVSISPEAKQQLQSLFENYFELKNNLVGDDFKAAQQTAKEFQEKLEMIDMKLFGGNAHTLWMRNAAMIKVANEKAIASKDIEELRGAFIQLSKGIIELNRSFQPLKYDTYIQHCPMANNNKGADWLSKEKEIKNPYFGSSMLNCGELKS